MSNITRAAFWMTGAIVSFTSMAVAGRELAPTFDTFEIMFYRSVLGVIIVCALAWAAGTLHEIKRDRLGMHLVRNVAHFTGQNLWFYAVTVIPLAQVFALEFTSPIWVILLAPLVLGERLTVIRIIAVATGFIGILIVARPTVDGLNAGVITAATAAIFFAITTLLTSKLARTQSITCIMFYLTAIQLVLGFITVIYDGDITLPTAASLPWLGVVGLGGLLAHFCIANALAIAPAAVVAPIDFLRLPTIVIVGMLLYHETIDIWVFVGALIIFAGNYLNLWFATKRA